MYKKIEITGKIELVTGMHIGGSPAFAAIGAVDSPIVRDVRSNLPMLPGSSFKGKMRTLLARAYNEGVAGKPDEDCEELTRLFGCAKKDGVKRSRILVSDMIMENADQLRQQGISTLTEVKVENSINRKTAVATPRQIERAIRGTIFPMNIIYEVEDDTQLLADMRMLADGFCLLEYDYIGGSGSRGYGKIKITDVNVEVVVGELDDAVVVQCSQILQRAE